MRQMPARWRPRRLWRLSATPVQTLARNSAIAAAQQNLVWGEAPGITGADVMFSPCPPGVRCPAGATCVRANVFRTSYQGGGGTPLPTFFANIVGIGEQGTRATATAQVLASSGTADCVKPWAIPDMWDEIDPGDTDICPIRAGRTGAGTCFRRRMLPGAERGGTGTGYQLPTDFGLPAHAHAGCRR